jgi:hypothetical protein
MDADFDEVELGLIVNIKILREVLKTLSIDGKRWWIASDPHDAATTGYISIGHGDPHCTDRLNTLHFRIPTVGNETPRARTDRIILLLDLSTCSAEESGFYLENGRVVEDSLEDLISFYFPIRNALIARLQAGD